MVLDEVWLMWRSLEEVGAPLPGKQKCEGHLKMPQLRVGEILSPPVWSRWPHD